MSVAADGTRLEGEAPGGRPARSDAEATGSSATPEPAPVLRETRIRSVEPDDLAPIAALERVSFSTPWSPASFRSLLGRDGVQFLVAVREEPEATSRIAGYAILWAVGGEAELADLAVEPRLRGHGIGGALVDALIAGARGHEVQTVFLEVRESNEAALRLYRGRGFRQVGVRPHYYTRPREAARVLCLDLTPEQRREPKTPLDSADMA